MIGKEFTNKAKKDNIYCDKCAKKSFVWSINIDQSSVEVDGHELMVQYFMCPNCGAFYRILIVEENKYRDMVDDLKKIQKRIKKVSRSNPILATKLQGAETIKQNRIKSYVKMMDSKYPIDHFTVFKNPEGDKFKIVYLPREARMKGDK